MHLLSTRSPALSTSFSAGKQSLSRQLKACLMCICVPAVCGIGLDCIYTLLLLCRCFVWHHSCVGFPVHSGAISQEDAAVQSCSSETLSPHCALRTCQVGISDGYNAQNSFYIMCCQFMSSQPFCTSSAIDSVTLVTAEANCRRCHSFQRPNCMSTFHAFTAVSLTIDRQSNLSFLLLSPVPSPLP